MDKLRSLRFWLLIVLLHLVNGTAISVVTGQSGEFYCLQFRTSDSHGDQRLLLDVFTGKSVRTRVNMQLANMPLYRFSSAAAPATSPDGKYTMFATYEGQTASLWVEGEGVTDHILAEMSQNVTFFEWMTNRHFVAVAMNDPEMTIVAIDLQSGVPVVMRQDFEIRNFDLTPPRIANALLVRHVAQESFLMVKNAQFWVAEQNRWTAYDLTLPTGPVDGLPLTPGYVVPKAVYSFEHETVHGFVVVDPAHGIDGVITYPDHVGFHESFWLQWLPDAKHLMVRDSNDGLTQQLEVWQLDEATPILTGKGTVPPNAASIPIWSADGSSFVYTSTEPDGRSLLNVYWLNKPDDPVSVLLDGKAILRLFVAQSVPAPTTLLVSTLRAGRFNLYWVNADGITTLLAENGQHAPRVSFYGDYAYTVWQTVADRRLLIIDMKDAHHVSTVINPTLEIAPPYGKVQDHTGDISIIVLGSTDQPRSTFLAINRRTGQSLQLLNEKGQIKWIVRGDQPGSFQVGWLTADGRQLLTMFGVDGTPQATFGVPGSLQFGLIKVSPDGRRAIEFNGLLGDHYLSFSDGSFKELLPVPATLTWMPDSKHIVGANAILGNSTSEAYLLDADGTLLARYPLPYPARLAPMPLVKCP